jgi:hypothetical protein
VDRPQALGENRLDFDLLSEGAAQELAGGRHEGVDVGSLGAECLLARESEQLPRQARRPFHRLADLAEAAGHAVVELLLFLEGIDIGQDHREDIVEVVGDAAGELSDGFHFLRLSQLLGDGQAGPLGAIAFGDVLDGRQDGRSAIHFDPACTQLDVDDRAVPGTMAQSLNRLGSDAGVIMLPQQPHFGDVFGDVEVVAVQGERFLARPAILCDRGVVDCQDVARIAVDDDHRIGIGVEQHTVAILGRRQLGLPALAFGDVDAQHHPTAAGQVDGVETPEGAAGAGNLEHAARVEAGDPLLEPGIPVRLGIFCAHGLECVFEQLAHRLADGIAAPGLRQPGGAVGVDHFLVAVEFDELDGNRVEGRHQAGLHGLGRLASIGSLVCAPHEQKTEQPDQRRSDGRRDDDGLLRPTALTIDRGLIERGDNPHRPSRKRARPRPASGSGVPRREPLRPAEPNGAVLADQFDPVLGSQANIDPDPLEGGDVDQCHQDAHQPPVALARGVRHGNDLRARPAAANRAADAGVASRAVEMDAEVFAVGPVGHARQFVGPQAADDDAAMGIDEEQVAEQMDRHPSAASEFDELLRRVELTDFVLGVTHGLLNAGHHRVELIGHGLEQLLDMFLAGLSPRFVDLAHDKTGEAGDQQHYDSAGHADQPALVVGEGRRDPRPGGSGKCGGPLGQPQSAIAARLSRRRQGLHE